MSETGTSKGEMTRARIVEAAYQLFIQQGYHGTSMRQIVERAGITMGGIYNHFPNKEAIWETVLLNKHPYHEILPLLESVEAEDIAGFIRQAASRLVRELGRREDLLNLMFVELVEFNGKHVPALFAAILPEAIQLSATLNRKSGEMRPVPLPILARSFAGFFFSYYVTERLLPPTYRTVMGEDAALQAFVDIYLYGIIGEEKRCKGD